MHLTTAAGIQPLKWGKEDSFPLHSQYMLCNLKQNDLTSAERIADVAQCYRMLATKKSQQIPLPQHSKQPVSISLELVGQNPHVLTLLKIIPCLRGELVRKVHFFEKLLLYGLTTGGRVSCCLLKRKHTLMAFKKSTFHPLSQLVLKVKDTTCSTTTGHLVHYLGSR